MNFRDHLLLNLINNFNMFPLEKEEEKKRVRERRTLQAIQAADEITVIVCSCWGHVAPYNNGEQKLQCARCGDWYDRPRMMK